MSPKSSDRTLRPDGDAEQVPTTSCGEADRPSVSTITTRQPGGPPRRDVDGCSGVTEGGQPIPDRELVGVGVEEPRPQHRHAHRELAAVAVEHVIAEKGTVGRIDDLDRGVQAALEPGHPALAAGSNGAPNELLPRKGEDDMQLGAVLEQRLRPEDVRAVRERTVRVPRLVTDDLVVDSVCDRRL